MMLTITTNSFENDVLRADKPVLVDFWAQWCPYCRRIAPAFDKVGEQYADTLIAGKINYDEEPQLIRHRHHPHADALQGRRGARLHCRARLQGGHRGVYQGSAFSVRRQPWKKSTI